MVDGTPTCRTCDGPIEVRHGRGRPREYCNSTCRSAGRRRRGADDVVRCEMQLGDWLCSNPAVGRLVTKTGTDRAQGWRTPEMARLRRTTRDSLPWRYQQRSRPDVYLCSTCRPLAESWLRDRQSVGTWRSFGPTDRSWLKRSKRT